MEKTNQFYKFLDKLETEYSPYIGRKSLRKLAELISAYLMAYYELSGEHIDFWGAFQDFTERYYEKKFKIKGSCWCIKSWPKIIEFFSGSDEEAFSSFYILYADFKKANEIK